MSLVRRRFWNENNKMFRKNRFEQTPFVLLVILPLVLASCPLALVAASITWNAPVTISGDADVSTNGGLLYAYDDANISTTVNGIPFAPANSMTAFGSNVGLSGNYSWTITAFGSSTGSPWTTLSSEYQNTLRGAAYASNNGTQTVTLKNLIVGRPYEVQLWVNDNRSLASNRTEMVTSSGGNSVTLDYNSTGAAGGVGQYTIGTFTADATTQVITLVGVLPVGGNSAQLNAIQVRDQSLPDGTITSTVTLNPATTYQTIYGIGGNFCQGDQKLLRDYNRYNQVFSASGLNFSFIRLSTSFEMTNARFAGYDAANIAVTTNFRALQPNGKITLSQWSPPENLKSTASAYGGTLAKVGGQYVYTNFANWWVRTLQFYQASNALPDYLSIQNEPDFASSGTNFAYQAGSYLSSTESASRAGYPQALPAVKSALTAAGLGSQKIVGPDTTAIGSSTVATYLANAAPATVDAIGHHLYGDGAATTGTSKLATLNSQYPYTTIPKFMTEGNPFDDQETYAPTNQPDWMHLAVAIHNYFTIENANAYLVWNVMYATVGYWNGLPNGTETYYPLGHFSKFVRPGDRRANVTCSDSDVLVSLYRRTNSSPQIGDQLVLVMINSSSNYSFPVIQTTAHWAADPLQRAWKVYQTANDGVAQQRLTLTENLAGTNLFGDRSLTLAPYSITTAVINTGIFSNAAPVFTSTAVNQTINPAQSLNLTNAATDANAPAQTIAFSLPIAPTNAALNSSNGILNWRPLITQANTTNSFLVVVSDSATPSLSATQNFNVTVRSVTQPIASQPAMSNGQFSLKINGATGPDYSVQASSNLLTWTNIFTTNPAALPFFWADTNAGIFPRRFYRVTIGP
jgi:O-glycosyl hydrolase